MAGTFRALLNNMVTGVSEGFEKKLTWWALVIARRPRAESEPAAWATRTRSTTRCPKA